MKNKKPHVFRDLDKNSQTELFSNYLVNRWSYSAVNTFARNQKAFEKSYVWRERFKSSAASVGGSAYHEALEHYFYFLKNGERKPPQVEMLAELTDEESKRAVEDYNENKEVLPDLVDLDNIAFAYVYSIKPDAWKCAKKTPNIEECQKVAIKTASSCIQNFLKEISTYLDEIEEVLEVETFYSEFLTINGVDIPLPCSMKVDLVVRTKDQKIVGIDHKSTSKYTAESDAVYQHGKQGVTYAIGIEAATDYVVDEFWFFENKHSKNSDKTPQLRLHRIPMDKNTRRLYEAFLYEPLQAMVKAVSDPDYVFIMNDTDNFVDKGEMYAFAIKTLISDVEDFDVPENKKELLGKRLKKMRNASVAAIDPKVIKKFKVHAASFITYDLSNKNMNNSEKIEYRLNTFSIPARVAHRFDGYSSDTFLLDIAAGTKTSQIYRHRLDLAHALGVESVRLGKDLHVHEGKAYFVIEAAKKRTKELVWGESFQTDLKIPLGVTNSQETIFWDTDNPSTPHMLVCGSTGSGKSVFIESTIKYAKAAGFNNFIIFDPKFEFKKYNNLSEFEVYNDIELCEIKLADIVKEMNERIANNQSFKTMIIFDEYADAVESARSGSSLDVYKFVTGARGGQKRIKVGRDKSLPENMKMLLQKGRSSGYRIIAATQRASTKVITGDAKVNFPIQVCFRVNKTVDSKVVLDEPGAEHLAGRGDGLIRSPDYQSLMRFQGFYI